MLFIPLHAESRGSCRNSRSSNTSKQIALRNRSHFEPTARSISTLEHTHTWRTKASMSRRGTAGSTAQPCKDTRSSSTRISVSCHPHSVQPCYAFSLLLAPRSFALPSFCRRQVTVTLYTVLLEISSQIQLTSRRFANLYGVRRRNLFLLMALRNSLQSMPRYE